MFFVANNTNKTWVIFCLCTDPLGINDLLLWCKWTDLYVVIRNTIPFYNNIINDYISVHLIAVVRQHLFCFSPFRSFRKGNKKDDEYDYIDVYGSFGSRKTPQWR